MKALVFSKILQIYKKIILEVFRQKIGRIEKASNSFNKSVNSYIIVISLFNDFSNSTDGALGDDKYDIIVLSKKFKKIHSV